MIDLKDHIIILTSDEPYSKMWHTQLIYTEFLSKNNTVFYINPPKKWNLKNLFMPSFNDIKENNNLIVINYINRLPVFFKPFNVFNEFVNEYNVSRKIKHLGNKNIIVWHFDSFRSSFSHDFFDKSLLIKRIYHVIDPYFNNPTDKWLSKKADLIIATSSRNNEHYTKFLDKLINIPQCLNLGLQQVFLNAPSTLRLKFTDNYFILLGTISEDIEFSWILKLLNIRDFKLIIIGKTINLDKNANTFNYIISQPNVDYLGLLSPQEFYPILKKASAGLVVYNDDRRSKVCSPLKALNYIISGLPVITNIDCEIPELLDNSIFYSETLDEYVSNVNFAINKSLKVNENIVETYLNKISLENAVKKIANII